MDTTFFDDAKKLHFMMTTLERNENPHSHNLTSHIVMNSHPGNGPQALCSIHIASALMGFYFIKVSLQVLPSLLQCNATAQTFTSKNHMAFTAPEMASNSHCISYTDNKNGPKSKRKLLSPIHDRPPKSFKT
ncbi:hypothetical protein XELAEV_18015699mg [Xenopus laevis]|uniref:Uncharacterized protein n=1 Tax=Xenopus laevis TaxID=8355 RepID=A0A974HWN3_XENLA|nr:hypothetical protein XELAEV_18015699mg [Xenopus laevis]